MGKTTWGGRPILSKKNEKNEFSNGFKRGEGNSNAQCRKHILWDLVYERKGGGTNSLFSLARSVLSPGKL